MHGANMKIVKNITLFYFIHVRVVLYNIKLFGQQDLYFGNHIKIIIATKTNAQYEKHKYILTDQAS
jgi:hypothetical protein